MTDTLQALTQLRTDIIEALTRLEIQVTALQYAAVQQSGQPMNAGRLEQLQHAAESDVATFRTYYEENIRPVA